MIKYTIAFIVPYIIYYIIKEYIWRPFMKSTGRETKDDILDRINSISRGNIIGKEGDDFHHNSRALNQDQDYHLIDPIEYRISYENFRDDMIKDPIWHKWEDMTDFNRISLYRVAISGAFFQRIDGDPLEYSLYGQKYKEWYHHKPYELISYDLYSIETKNTIGKSINYKDEYPNVPLLFSARTLHEMDGTIGWVSIQEARYQSYLGDKNNISNQLKGDTLKRYHELFKIKNELGLTYEPYWGYDEEGDYTIIWDKNPSIQENLWS